MTYCVKTHRVHHSVVTMVTMMTQRLAMMADTNGMKELIESAIQDINTKYSYNTTTINDNYVLASLPEDCFYEVKSVSGRDHKWKAHVVTELKKEHVNEWIAA